MTEHDNLLTRRQLIGLLGGTGVAIGMASGLEGVGSGEGNLNAGRMALNEDFNAKDDLFWGPLSVRADVPQRDGVTFIQTDAGANNDKYKFFTYDSGWQAKGLDTPAITTEQVDIAEADIGGSGQDGNVGLLGDSLRVGVYPDPHYNEISRKSWGSGGGAQRSTLDDFIDEMNDEYKPHFVMVPGDVSHGIDGSADGLPSESTKISWTQTIIDLLENSGGSDGNGLDAPVFYTLGDHDYAAASNWNMNNIYAEFGWSGLSDTFYSFDVGGWHIVVLNTSYSTHNIFEVGGSNESETWIPDSSDPFDALDWLRKDIRDTERPICVFGHHPLAYGAGNTSKDFTGYQYEVSELLSRKQNVLYLHGHSHHSWGEPQTHTGLFGVRNIFINEPEDDNYGKLALNGTSYSIVQANDRTNFTHWRGLSQHLGGLPNPYDEAHLAVRQSFIEETVRHMSSQRASTFGGGTTEFDNSGYRMATGTSAGTEAGFKGRTMGILEDQTSGGNVPWEGRSGYWDVDFRVVGSAMACEIVTGDVSGGLTNQHIGFVVESNSLKPSVADGTTQNKGSAITSFSSSQMGRLGYIYEAFKAPGAGSPQVRFFWNGEEKATLSSNIPTGVGNGEWPYYYAVRNPGVTDNYVLGVTGYHFRQPNVHEPYTY